VTAPLSLDALQGSWRLEEARAAGHPVAEGEVVLVITGDRFERRTPAHTFLRRIVLTPSPNGPTHLDLHVLNAPGAGELFLGLIKREGDQLTLCHALHGKPRPTAFSSTEQDGQVLSISRRVAPAG
jgi:uncharacterized protein (TIGR03067 family)